MHPVSELAKQNTIPYWVIIGVATTVVGGTLVVFFRFAWKALASAFREWVIEPPIAAAQAAQAAAEHAVELKEAVGVPNGNGDIATMLAKSLGNQAEMFAWQREHDAKDDQTRSDVNEIKKHLGL